MSFLKQLCKVVALALLATCLPVSAQKRCEPGQQLLGDTCLSQAMTEYLVCIAATGSNQAEVSEFVSSKAKEAKGGKVEANGKNIAIQIGGAVSLNAIEERDIARLVKKNYFAGATTACQRAFDIVERKVSVYSEPKRRSDIRLMTDYLIMNGSNEGAASTQTCARIPVSNMTRSVEISEGEIIVKTISTSRTTCADSPFVERRTERQCRAPIGKLDEVVIPSSPDGGVAVNVRTKCLSGACATCSDRTHSKAADGQEQDFSRDYESSEFTIHVSSNGGNSGMGPLGDFLRALSRLIGKGDDSAFCNRAAVFCKS